MCGHIFATIFPMHLYTSCKVFYSIECIFYRVKYKRLYICNSYIYKVVFLLYLISQANIEILSGYLLITRLDAIAAYRKGLIPLLIQTSSPLLLRRTIKVGNLLDSVKFLQIHFLLHTLLPECDLIH